MKLGSGGTGGRCRSRPGPEELFRYKGNAIGRVGGSQKLRLLLPLWTRWALVAPAKPPRCRPQSIHQLSKVLIR
jgi:hypothetical protein